MNFLEMPLTILSDFKGVCTLGAALQIDFGQEEVGVAHN